MIWLPGVQSARVVREPQPAELPACRRIEEVAVAWARMALGRRVRAAAQHHLIDHELAVVLAERTGRRAESRIGRIGTARPLPDDPEGIVDEPETRGHLPLCFGRQVLAGPARERIGFVVAHVRDPCGRIDWPEARGRELLLGAVALAPVTGCLPALGLDRRPAVREPERGGRVAAVGDEIEPLRISDEAAGEPHWLQMNLMRRA